MAQNLSLEEISEIWKNSSVKIDNFGYSTLINEAVFNISLDKNGRAYFFFSDKKGKKLDIDEIQSDGTALGLAVERIKQQRVNLLSWNSDEESSIYLDENAEFTYQLFKGERNFLYKKKIVSNSLETERAKIELFVKTNKIDDENEIERETDDTKNKTFSLSLVLKTENEILQNPIPLTANYALCKGKIHKTRDLGINYNYLASFSGTASKNELEEYLSLFASLFPQIKIKIEGWTEFLHPAVNAEAGLNFSGLDEDGNLSINLLWSYEPFSTEFISKNKPSNLIRLNEESRTITKIPVFYDGNESFKKMNSLLKSCITRHPECKDEETNAYTIDGTNLYITSELALHFLSENLSELAQNYKLFGTEALKKYKLKTSTPKTHLKVKSGIDFFDTQCTVEIEGEIMSPTELVKLYEENKYIPLSDGTRAIIDKNFFLHLKRLLGKQQKDGSYKISFFDMPLVDSLINAKIDNEENKPLPWETFFSGFNSIQNQELPSLPVTEKLRDYQKYGLKWLYYLSKNKIGSCLADDMGLGKTIQTISLLATFYFEKMEGNTLIVVPKSLIDNWISELSRFAPELSVYAYYGTERNIEEAKKNKIILTTYAIARNDIEILQKEKFAFAILDEVQQIKNVQSQSSKAVMLLNAEHRVALSGTPMENNLSELYSIFRFLNPAMFGTEGDFNRRYAIPIQKDGDEDAAKELSAKIRPFILRRLKQEVAKELPEKTEQVLYVDMSQSQAALYEKQRIFYQNLISGEIKKNGFEKSQFCILQGLTELRQIATVPESKTDGEVEGAKWAELTEKITEIASSGHRSLVFSNFLASLDAMGEKLDAAGIPYLVMTGATSNRAELVKKFQADDTYKVFLMTLKTGGVGLNLTGADYVFILDPWWNRSAEQQAIDRTHRIGQTKAVFCYRLIARGTIEEKIMELQQKKTDLFSAIISSDGQQIKKLSEEDINYLLRG